MRNTPCHSLWPLWVFSRSGWQRARCSSPDAQSLILLVETWRVQYLTELDMPHTMR